MKNIIIFILAAIISSSVFSQDFESGDLNKRFYIRAGLSTPTWTYYGYSNINDLKTGLNAESKIGGIFEIGTIFILNGINLGDGLRLGINVDFISLKSQVFNLQGSENLYNFFVGSKIGPSLTYSPARAVSFDVFAKLNPVWVGAIYYNHQNFDNGIDMYYAYTQFMYSFGINVRLAVFMLGFEYDIGGLKLKNNQNSEYWPNHSNPSSNRTPMNGFNTTIGLSF
ncbi:MAG: hypothetical protein H8E34_07445 [Bacteroidetes bacterium]|nr:hypothetical protein [Bacteroidota bacterium]MBL6943568.1 hypothetical protein [Bacteroidales bacterium]